MAKVNAATHRPGQKIYLARGATFAEKLVASSSGLSGQTIDYGAYGSGADPIINGGNVREDLIDSNGKSYLTFRNIEVQDSQASANGYGVNIHGGTGVTVEDVTIRRSTKHSLGAIQTKDFIARRVRAYDLAAGQGAGGATTFVSYGVAPLDQDHQWIDCESTTGHAEYPTFIQHGDGPRNVAISNMVEHTSGSGFTQYSDSTDTRVTVTGSTFYGSTLYSGDHTVISGSTFLGILTITFGTNVTLQNSTLTELVTDWHAGRPGVVSLGATASATLTNNTITTGLATGNGSAVSLTANTTTATLSGNRLVGDIAIRLQYDGAAAGIVSDNNVWCTIGTAQQGSVAQTTYSLAAWRTFSGQDAHSTTVVCP